MKEYSGKVRTMMTEAIRSPDRPVPARCPVRRFALILFILLCSGNAVAQDFFTGYESTALVANKLTWSTNADSSLINPWGMAWSSDGGPWWVVNEGRGRATLYTGAGTAFPGLSPLVISIPVNPGGVYDYSTPTGVVYNDTRDFELDPGAPSRFIFVTRDGTIAGWNGAEYWRTARLIVDNSPEAVYTGATIGRLNSQNVLYVANFGRGSIEVFGPDFAPLLLKADAFYDPLVPEDFAPYNIQNINGELLVTYAETQSYGHGAVYGDGLGYVDVFDMEGRLVLRLEQGPWMNAPWGIALASSGFGAATGRLLAANSGSGMISTFDYESGAFAGYLTDREAEPLVIPGLHGLGFGNGGLAGPGSALFFTAGFHDWGPSIFGAIIPKTTARERPLLLRTPGMSY